MHLLAFLVAVCRCGASSRTCRRFVVISMQRSGSHYAIETLKAHPGIGAAGELFADGHMQYASGFSASKKVIEDAMKRLCDRGAEVVGFKWMLNQGHDENRVAIARYFSHHGVKIVYLWRRNSLRQLISNTVNKATEGLAHPSGDALAAVRSTTIVVPTNRLVRHLKDIESKRRRVRSYYMHLSNVTSITVFYEDLIAASPNFDAAWGRLANFLAVAAFSFPRSAAGVIHQGAPILAPVANAGDVRATLYAACDAGVAGVAHAHVSPDLLAICADLRVEEKAEKVAVKRAREGLRPP